jgi:hypothetical protein
MHEHVLTLIHDSVCPDVLMYGRILVCRYVVSGLTALAGEVTMITVIIGADNIHSCARIADRTRGSSVTICGH